jgi:hypothetical protein
MSEREIFLISRVYMVSVGAWWDKIAKMSSYKSE